MNYIGDLIYHDIYKECHFIKSIYWINDMGYYIYSKPKFIKLGNFSNIYCEKIELINQK